MVHTGRPAEAGAGVPPSRSLRGDGSDAGPPPPARSQPVTPTDTRCAPGPGLPSGSLFLPLLPPPPRKATWSLRRTDDDARRPWMVLSPEESSGTHGRGRGPPPVHQLCWGSGIGSVTSPVPARGLSPRPSISTRPTVVLPAPVFHFQPPSRHLPSRGPPNRQPGSTPPPPGSPLPAPLPEGQPARVLVKPGSPPAAPCRPRPVAPGWEAVGTGGLWPGAESRLLRTGLGPPWNPEGPRRLGGRERLCMDLGCLPPGGPPRDVLGARPRQAPPRSHVGRDARGGRLAAKASLRKAVSCHSGDSVRVSEKKTRPLPFMASLLSVVCLRCYLWAWGLGYMSSSL